MAHDYDTTVGVQIEALSDAEIQSLTKLETKLKSVSSFLKKNTTSINKYINNAQNVATTTTKSAKGISTLGVAFSKSFKVGNMIYLMNMAKYVSQAFSQGTLKRAIDFTETVNLFGVAMREASGDALKFQHTINNAVATSMDSMMNAQAKFQTMLSSMAGNGTDRTALYGLSETLTKMAMDYSSLYNISIDDAITKYQSALAQQVRPIRSTSGYDITQNTLKETLADLNIDKPISKLTQMEKRLLIIYSLNEQMAKSGAMDDYARTIESPAQQLKVLQNLLEEIGRYIGGVFYPLLTKILPVINGIAWALKEVLKTLAYFVGYDPFSEMKQSDALGEYINGANDGVEDTIDSVDKLKKKVAGFDELNDITPSSSSNDSALGDMSVSDDILNALSEYDSNLENVKMKAEGIRDTIMSWLGFTQEMNAETGELLWKFTGWKGIDLEPMMKAFSEFKAQLEPLFAILQQFFGWFNQNVVQPLFKYIVETFLPKAIELGGAVVNVVVAIINALQPVAEQIWNGIVAPLLELAGSAIGDIFDALINVLTFMADWIDNNQEQFRAFVGFVLALVAGFKMFGFATSVASAFKTLASVTGTLSQFIKGLVEVGQILLMLLKSVFGEIIAFAMANPWVAIATAIAGLFVYLYTANEEFRSWVNGIFEGIFNYLEGLVGRWSETGRNMMQGLFDGLMSLNPFKVIWELFTGIIQLVLDIFGIHSPSTVFTDIGTNIMQGLFNGLQRMYDKVVGWFRGLKNTVSDIVGGITSKVSDITSSVKESAGEVINKATTAIKDTASSVAEVGSKIQTNLGSVSTATGNAVKTTWDKVISSASNIASKVKSFLIPQFANGGFPSRGDLFIANEAGPELVANIGGKNMVANQQQLFNSLTEAFRQMIGNQNSTPQTINLVVDGKVLAKTTVENMNKLTNQLGYSPLAF